MKKFKYIAVAMLMTAAFGVTSVFALTLGRGWFGAGMDWWPGTEYRYCPNVCAGTPEGWTLWSGESRSREISWHTSEGVCRCVKPNDKKCDGDGDCASGHCCSGVCKECCYANSDCNKTARSVCKDFKCVLPPDAKPYQICKCDNGCYGLRVSRSGKLDSEHCEDACKRVGGSTYTNALVAGSRWWEIGKSYQDFASKYGSQALPKEIYDKVYENTSFCP